MALCRELAPRTDAIDRGLAAKGFGFGGVPRERAYHDALRDLAVPAMGHPPLVRITAPGRGLGAALTRLGSWTSVAETLIVLQTPHFTRTLNVIASSLIDSASRLPHCTHT